ncbi:MAG: radical SAM protein [Candidatus Aminicenantales bacterium]
MSRRKVVALPRLPLAGSIDLTYRCNNDCRHCWLRLSPDFREKGKELTADEIRRLVEEARSMGCRKWNISGGEPMLRPDFEEIFDFITSRSANFTLNTNGTLMTPRIASLMKRKGSKLVALYGADAEVHDRVTRNPGSFEAMMRGVAYLKEAGAEFTVQIIPMKSNYHQYEGMLGLARTLSRSWRIGAPWLWLSSCGDPGKNREIERERLDAAEMIRLDEPEVAFDEWAKEESAEKPGPEPGDDRLFAACVHHREAFHVDPYGNMSFCGFVKDPALRYDLRKGNFREGWEDFVPSLADKIHGGKPYLENCGSCELRGDCRWCAVYGFLEHRDHAAKVDFLCRAAVENRKYKENWKREHRRFYDIAGITIRVESDLPFSENTFSPKFKLFEVPKPGPDMVTIRHHFSLPDLEGLDLGKEVYRRTPWAIYQKGDSWIYLGIYPPPDDHRIHRVVVGNRDHTRIRIFNPDSSLFLQGNMDALTLFSSDQILIARILADRKACYLHSAGLIVDGLGLIFAGHSEAGKSTTVKMLRDKAEVLCDDRMIVRQWPDGFRIHGTWSHGEIPEVSHSSAPLRAILFLEKSPDNRLIPIESRAEKVRKLLEVVVRPLTTVDWWEKILTLVEAMADNVPCYTLHFDKSGRVVEALKELKGK